MKICLCIGKLSFSGAENVASFLMKSFLEKGHEVSALLLEKKPNLLPDQVKQILISYCRRITYNKNLEGFGYPCFKA